MHELGGSGSDNLTDFDWFVAFGFPYYCQANEVLLLIIIRGYHCQNENSI